MITIIIAITLGSLFSIGLIKITEKYKNRNKK
jgi:hypothetical protein